MFPGAETLQLTGQIICLCILIKFVELHGSLCEAECSGLPLVSVDIVAHILIKEGLVINYDIDLLLVVP